MSFLESLANRRSIYALGKAVDVEKAKQQSKKQLNCHHQLLTVKHHVF
jgi:predicted oxidoreductase (fatty acid repression mutant protein)